MKRGARRRTRRGGTQRYLVGIIAQVPYGGRVEVGTITGVYTRNSGVVGVSLNNPKLYELERRLIFGTAQAAQAHLHKLRKRKAPTSKSPPQ